MRKLGMMAVVAATALMLSAALPAVAGSPKGVCQAGGYNKVVLANAMAKYWNWNYGGGWLAGDREPVPGAAAEQRRADQR